MTPRRVLTFFEVPRMASNRTINRLGVPRVVAVLKIKRNSNFKIGWWIKRRTIINFFIDHKHRGADTANDIDRHTVPFLLRDAWLVPKEGHRCGLQQKDIYGRTTIRIISFCVCAGDDGDLFPIEDRTLLLVAGVTRSC
jgi:hypothetical protein